MIGDLACRAAECAVGGHDHFGRGLLHRLYRAQLRREPGADFGLAPEDAGGKQIEHGGIVGVVRQDFVDIDFGGEDFLDLLDRGDVSRSVEGGL